ncbi:MAG: hypothetical protein HYZ71_12035 [Deltaproteobacteria bacterium]|nr:hypothetical protein [Deltaproteobacteria bacterium]
MRAFWLILIGSAAFGQVHDEKLLATLDKTESFLYDHSNHLHHYIAAKKNYVPHRVYVRYDTDLHSWAYFKADLVGRVPEPIEFLRPDTVTFGKVIGAPLGLQHFKLAENGNWVPTRDKEIYLVWVKSDPPKTKAFVYQMQAPRTKPMRKSEAPEIPALRLPATNH